MWQKKKKRLPKCNKWQPKWTEKMAFVVDLQNKILLGQVKLICCTHTNLKSVIILKFLIVCHNLPQIEKNSSSQCHVYFVVESDSAKK